MKHHSNENERLEQIWKNGIGFFRGFIIMMLVEEEVAKHNFEVAF